MQQILRGHSPDVVEDACTWPWARLFSTGTVSNRQMLMNLPMIPPKGWYNFHESANGLVTVLIISLPSPSLLPAIASNRSCRTLRHSTVPCVGCSVCLERAVVRHRCLHIAGYACLQAMPCRWSTAACVQDLVQRLTASTLR